jgi:serine/threonine-protein kinase
MTQKRQSQISLIFAAARELGPQSRGAFLLEACAGDEDLRQEVERMLADVEHATEFPDPPISGPPIATRRYDDIGLSSQVAEGEFAGKLVQGRYRIQSRLGAGGMGEVFLADDPKLKRRVALKRLPPQMRSDERYRSSLLREARRASSLNDPHIAHVYDVLEEEGEAFLLMEYIEGKTLRHRIASPLPPVEFLDIAIQCAEALLSAHRKGVVHCDIKPENIMLTTAGQVKILDFGIAKRLPFDEAGTSTHSEELEGLYGTPSYLAPEVWTGHVPDAGSDIYSLGVTLYEAWTGKRPRQSSFPNSAVSGEDAVPDRPAPPEVIELILTRMLQPDPAKRYSDTQELLRDLRSVQGTRSWEVRPRPIRPALLSHRTMAAMGAVLLLAILAGTAVTRVRPWVNRMLHPVPGQKQVAVLPFSVAGADSGTKAFADGLSEVLSAKLTQLTERPEFQVVPVSEVRAKHVTTAADARDEFGVNLVIEGTWQQASGLVHVVPVLIDAATNRQLRANEFVAASSDPIGLETSVASGVLRMLEIELRPAERNSFANQGTTKPDAYAYYLQGRGYLEEFQKPENVEMAISVFGHALTEDPHYGQAYAGLGEAYWRKYEHTADAQWVPKARQACAKAAELGNAGVAGNYCLGLIDNGTGKYQDAAEQFQKALTLEPTSDASFVGLAAAYEGMGRMEDAERTYRQAIELRPQHARSYNWLGVFYHRRARYPDAIRLFSQAVKLSPDSYVGYSNLGGTYVDDGDYQLAVPMLSHSIAIRPTYEAYSNLGTAYFYEGRFEDAVGSYEGALKLDDRHYDVWGNLADAYYWAPGRRDGSTAAYRRAIALAAKQYEVNPSDAVLLSYIAQYHAMLGEKDFALDGIGRALRLDPRSAEIAFTAAIVYNQIGDVESSLTMLKKAIAAGVSIDTVHSTPNFSNLESQPRFQDLLKKSHPVSGAGIT